MTREELAEMITAVYDRELQIDDVLMTLECEVHARQAAQRQVADLQERIARADVELQRAVLAEREACATLAERATDLKRTLQQMINNLPELPPCAIAAAIRARGKT